MRDASVAVACLCENYPSIDVRNLKKKEVIKSGQGSIQIRLPAAGTTGQEVELGWRTWRNRWGARQGLLWADGSSCAWPLRGRRSRRLWLAAGRRKRHACIVTLKKTPTTGGVAGVCR
jgi:hypothetical protein